MFASFFMTQSKAKAADVACVIEGACYSTLQEAINSTGMNESKIVLYEEVTENITIGYGKKILLDLNGKRITGAVDTKPVIDMTGKLSIKNSTNTKSYITGKSNYVIRNNGWESLEITGDINVVSTANNYDSTCIQTVKYLKIVEANIYCGNSIHATEKLELINVYIEANNTGIYYNGRSTVTISGGMITAVNGDAIYILKNAKVDINGDAYIYTESANHYAINNAQQGTVTVDVEEDEEGGNIVSAMDTDSGAVNNHGIFNLKNGVIIGNCVGVRNHTLSGNNVSATVNITGGIIESWGDCTSSDNSAAAIVSDAENEDLRAVVNVSNANIVVDDSTENINQYAMTLRYSDVAIESSTIVGKDYGIFSRNLTNITISGSTIIEADGEGVNFFAGDFNIIKGIIKGNKVGVQITGGTVNIGENVETFKAGDILISGGEYGIDNTEYGTLNFYGGMIRGTKDSVNGTISNEATYMEKKVYSEKIEDVTYQYSVYGQENQPPEEENDDKKPLEKEPFELFGLNGYLVIGAAAVLLIFVILLLTKKRK
jgi:hypothetical protein